MTARLLPALAATVATVAVTRIRRPMSGLDVALLAMVTVLLARGIASTGGGEERPPLEDYETNRRGPAPTPPEPTGDDPWGTR